MRILTGAAFAVLASSLAAPLAAQDSPIQLSLFTPVQIVPEEKGVSAVRLNLIYSANAFVRGVDLGLVNTTTGGPSSGVQWAFVAINKGSFSGWQSAAVSITDGRFEGLQWSWVNSAKEGEGLQLGFVNMATNWDGLQLGLVNYTERLHGVQVGLINIIKQDGQFPVFPIVNWSF
jgi:hypothetical protein